MIPDELADALALGLRPAMVLIDLFGRDVARVRYVIYADDRVVVVSVVAPGGWSWVEPVLCVGGGQYGLRRATEVAP